MTANKHFKHRVRERARRTGESYTAALRHLRRIDAQEHVVHWQRIEKPEFGYAVHVPQGWDERPPNLRNSPLETARFGDPADRRHNLTVFRGLPRPRWTAAEVAEEVQAVLEAAGFRDFHIADARIAERTGTRLDCAKHDAGRVWAVRQYFVVHDDVRFTLGCGSFIPEEDDLLFTGMAERFEILNSA